MKKAAFLSAAIWAAALALTIEKANLAYYKQFDAEVKKRTRGLFGATYREHKNLINPDRLAIVAFVQDNGKSHAVLQSAYEPVLGTAVAGAKEAQ
ncbi:MAG: hypothetical protein ACRD1Y_05630 [Terriglobales bacterium]